MLLKYAASVAIFLAAFFGMRFALGLSPFESKPEPLFRVSELEAESTEMDFEALSKSDQPGEAQIGLAALGHDCARGTTVGPLKMMMGTAYRAVLCENGERFAMVTNLLDADSGARFMPCDSADAAAAMTVCN